MNRALWIIQWLLAALFVFAGVMKFVMPVEEMTKQMPSMPGWFLHFIGVAEILGGVGLVLPALLRIQPNLTKLAAVCLVVIMIGATYISATVQGVAGAVLPFVVLLLVTFVAYGRWRVAPHV